MQWKHAPRIKERAPLNSKRFYARHVLPKIPYLVRHAISVLWGWLDDSLLAKAAGEWKVIVEQQNRVIDSFRRPFEQLTLRKFLRTYTRRPRYLITECAAGCGVHRFFPVHSELDCPELRTEVRRRLWMSHGNTSSSIHFDTHEALLVQADGERRVLLWPPEQAHHLYMDEGEHQRYGLSPINVDRVDLRRFSRLTDAVPFVVDLRPGDLLYVPALWWHHVSTPHGQRNVLLTTEFEFLQQIDQISHTPDGRGRRSNSSMLVEAAQRQRTETRPAELRCEEDDVDS